MPDRAGKYPGTLTNMVTDDWVADVEQGCALDFDGTNDNILVSSSTDFNFERTDAFSVFVWARTTVASPASTFQTLLARLLNAAPFPGWELLFYNDTLGGDGRYLQVYLLNDGNGVTPPNGISVHTTNQVIQTNAWALYGFTYDGLSSASGMTIYVNGGSQATTVYGNSLTASTQASANLRFGIRSNGSSLPFIGQMGEVRIYKGAVSPAVAWQMWDPATRFDLYESVRAVMVAVQIAGNTFDLTTSLAAGAAVSDAAALTVSAAIPLAASGGVNEGQNATLQPTASLPAQAALAQTRSVVLALQEALGVVAGVVGTGGPAYAQSLALAVTSALTATRSLTVDRSLTLSAPAQWTAQTALTLAAATALAGSAGFAPTGALIAPLVADLRASAALTAQETSTVVVATSLVMTARAQLATQAQQFHSSLLALGVDAATAQTSAAIYTQAVALALAAALQAQAQHLGPSVVQSLYITGEQLKQAVLSGELLRQATISNETLT